MTSPRQWSISRLLLLVLFVAIVSSGATPSPAQSFSTEFVADGLSRPVFLTAPPGDRDRAFVLEQHSGDIRILRLADGTLETQPFLTVTGISTGSEQGLLGLAFHPNYSQNGFLYVYITNPDSRVLRFQVSADPDVADGSSRTNVLDIAQFEPNHNGGWIGFGPDGYLYVATGDGGGSNDDGPNHTVGLGNAQDVTGNLLGKILRIDVDADDFPADADRNYAIPLTNPFVGVAGDDEIWAYGLRNPYRSSFDRSTGDLYVGDVGQDRCEEINVQLGSSSGGENYGWRLREGTIATPTGGVGGARPPNAIDPIMDYPHSAAGELCSNPGAGFLGISVIGGYVYRGPVAELEGRYFFADFLTAEIWSLRFDGSDPATFDGENYTELTNHSTDPRFIPDIGSIDRVSSFGEDDEGNLYVLDLSDGQIFRVPEPSSFLTNLSALACVALVVGYRRRVAMLSSARPPGGPPRLRFFGRRPSRAV